MEEDLLLEQLENEKDLPKFMVKFLRSFFVVSATQIKSNQDLNKKFDEFILKDTAWKKDAEPVIALGKSVKATSNGIMWILGTLLTIGTVWELLLKICKHKIW